MTVTANTGKTLKARFRSLITKSEEYTISGFKSDSEVRAYASKNGCTIISSKQVDNWAFMSEQDAISKGLTYLPL